VDPSKLLLSWAMQALMHNVILVDFVYVREREVGLWDLNF
jgi:hypothetical protein